MDRPEPAKGGGDECEFQVKDGIGERLRRVSDEKQNSGYRVDQNPNHITGKKRFISSSGTFGANPRIRRSTAVFNPATIPMPTVWTDRIPGKAQSDVDSRTQVLRLVASSQTKKGCTP